MLNTTKPQPNALKPACSFCRKKLGTGKIKHMVSSSGPDHKPTVFICNECLDLCDEIRAAEKW